MPNSQTNHIHRVYKLILGVVVFITVSVLLGVLYLKLTCKALQIARLHNGETRFSIVSNQGNEYEPANCGGSLIIQAME